MGASSRRGSDPSIVGRSRRSRGQRVLGRRPLATSDDVETPLDRSFEICRSLLAGYQAMDSWQAVKILLRPDTTSAWWLAFCIKVSCSPRPRPTSSPVPSRCRMRECSGSAWLAPAAPSLRGRDPWSSARANHVQSMLDDVPLGRAHPRRNQPCRGPGILLQQLMYAG